MPKVMEILGYIIYFWSNENNPLEPIHVHIDKRPHKNGTKIWILSDGSTRLEHNRSQIPNKILKRLMKTIEEYHDCVEEEWKKHFKIDKVIHIDKCLNLLQSSYKTR